MFHARHRLSNLDVVIFGVEAIDHEAAEAEARFCDKPVLGLSAAYSASIEHWNGKACDPADSATLQVASNEFHLGIEQRVLGIGSAPLSFDFKWTDNVPADADGMDFIDQGDTAPNSRFNFRYRSPN